MKMRDRDTGCLRVVLCGSVAAFLMAAAPTAKASVIADWTFETSTPATAGPFSPETGAGAASGSHASASTYSSPAGNGSSHSFSSNTWSVNDYYQFTVSTTGITGQDITIQFDQTSSNTGPKDFELEDSSNGSTFNNVEAYSVLANASPNPTWNATTSSSLYTVGPVDVGSALDNTATVYFRLVNTDTVSANGGVVATAGTDRVDNVIIAAVTAPEPASLALLGMAGAGLLLRRRTN